jgi:hypothetical protein
MRLYAVAMFVHVLGIIAVFGGFAMQHRAGSRLRHAARYDEARPWAELLAATRTMVPSGAGMLLASGGYLSARLWPNPPAWLVVAIVAVVFIGVAALAVVGPRFRAIGSSVAVGEGPLSAASTQAIAGAAAWTTLAATNGAALGTIWLMTARPALVEAVLVVLVPTIVGGIVGLRVARGAHPVAEAAHRP